MGQGKQKDVVQTIGKAPETIPTIHSTLFY